MRVRMHRVALVAAMAAATLNIWTGAPLLGIWVGSRLAGDAGLSMLAVLAVVATIGLTCLALIRVLAGLGAAYDDLTGRRPTVRAHVPWLRSLSGERPHERGGEPEVLSPLEYVLVGAVVLALVAFEAWFFFLAGSSIDQRSGR